MSTNQSIKKPNVSTLGAVNMSINPCDDSVEVEEADIEKAKCLYDILDKTSDLREKLRIPIDRWIKSKKPENFMTLWILCCSCSPVPISRGFIGHFERCASAINRRTTGTVGRDSYLDTSTSTRPSNLG